MQRKKQKYAGSGVVVVLLQGSCQEIWLDGRLNVCRSSSGSSRDLGRCAQ